MSIRTSRRGSSAPTISDVARAAGVSLMTVSRVINNEANVRPATREKVEAAIAQLNYAPNPAARSLAGAAQIRIGMLYSNPSQGFLSEFLLGTLDQASRLDVQMVVEKCEIGDHEVEVARHLIAGGIDGVILPPPLCEAEAVLTLLREAGVPSVVVATGRAPEDMPDTTMAVQIDDRAAAEEMTRHVMTLGHRRIGFICGNPNLTASARRYEGFRAALEAVGVPFDEDLVVPGLYTYRSGLDAAERLLDLPEPPTAIIASNDDMAAASVAVAHRRGLDVPSDLTVCGFDDTTLSTTIWPELTTIHQPIADMARAAVEMMATVIRQKNLDAAPHRLLDYSLIRRQSDAAPRRRPREI
jgi:LacI family transcriptional regulator